MRISATVLSAVLSVSGYVGPRAVGGEPGRFSAASHDFSDQLYQQFLILDRKQLAFEEGIQMLEETRDDLLIAQNGMDFWGTTAATANAVIIPLNIIINSFELKKANTLLKIVYQKLALAFYKKFARSGTRYDSQLKDIVAEIKKEILNELKSKGMADYVPGVSIIIGLAEDSFALYQSMEMVNEGKKEVSHQQININQHLQQLRNEIMKLGVQRAELLRAAEVRSRTS